MEKNEYLESVEMNTGVEMIPCESSNIEGYGYDSKKKQLWVALKITEYIGMMKYLIRYAMVYTLQNLRVNTWENI